jgi:hypothetical protein
MTYYFKSGSALNVEAGNAPDLLTDLPAGVYVVKHNSDVKKLYLQISDKFSLPSKLYGDPYKRVERIKRTFNDRERSTGVLLAGDKGSGKTLLCKALSCSLLEDGISTIIVNEPFSGDEFNTLIANIKQPALILFDEFDKVYGEDAQQGLLTLLDGTVETKKLFVLTTNSGYIDEHLLNRPGRIHYKFAYSGVSEDFVREYLQDKLKDKSHIESFVKISNAFTAFTFDMMQAIVDEMNRFDESPEVAIQDLNIDVSNENCTYSISLLYDGVPINNNYYPLRTTQNPLLSNDRIEVEIYANDNRMLTEKDIRNKNFPEIVLTKNTLAKMGNSGSMIYQFNYGKKAITAIVEKQKEIKFNFSAF